jgi:subtilisin family serine protease
VALCLTLAAFGPAGSAEALTPNDPYWFAAWGQRAVHMANVWDITTGNPNVIIAVIDTGVNPNLPDLQGALVPGWDFTAGTSNMTDVEGHGTAVTTELVARGNNGLGIPGYCWRCRVMPLRFTTGTGSGPSGPTLAQAIHYAVDHGVRIINVSTSDEGTGGRDPYVIEAINYAASRGVLVFSSAGNTGSNAETHPASFQGAYAVAGTDASDGLYPWSTRGGWVPFAAPGCQLVIFQRNDPETACGTSVTAPVVSGIAGLLLSAKPDLTAAQILWALTKSSVPIAGIGGGRVDAYGAFAALGLAPPLPNQSSPSSGPPSSNSTPLPGTSGANGAQILKGKLGVRRRVRVDVDEGRLRATFTSKKAKTCTVSLLGPDQVTIAVPAGGNKITLIADLPGGRYTIDISCSTKRVRPYQLTLIGKFAPATTNR